METKFTIMVWGFGVAIVLAITGCDDRKTNAVPVSQTNVPHVVTDVVVSNARVTVDASKEPSVEDDIHEQSVRDDRLRILLGREEKSAKGKDCTRG